MFHRHSAFPALVLALTAALALAFGWSAMRPDAPAPEAPAASAPAAPDYRAALKGALAGFHAAYEAAADDLARLAAAERALDQVLALKVPTEERDAHLAVAFALNQVRAGLRGEPGMAAKGLAALAAAEAAAPWLK